MPTEARGNWQNTDSRSARGARMPRSRARCRVARFDLCVRNERVRRAGFNFLYVHACIHYVADMRSGETRGGVATDASKYDAKQKLAARWMERNGVGTRVETKGEPAPTAVSLFSGCGGLDLGLIKAGFDIVWQTTSINTPWTPIGQHRPGYRMRRHTRCRRDQ